MKAGELRAVKGGGLGSQLGGVLGFFYRESLLGLSMLFGA